MLIKMYSMLVMIWMGSGRILTCCCPPPTGLWSGRRRGPPRCRSPARSSALRWWTFPCRPSCKGTEHHTHQITSQYSRRGSLLDWLILMNKLRWAFVAFRFMKITYISIFIYYLFWSINLIVMYLCVVLEYWGCNVFYIFGPWNLVD